MDSISVTPLHGGTWNGAYTLPLLLQPVREHGQVTLEQAGGALRAMAAQHLEQAGGLLFRGFGVQDVPGFRAFAASFGDELLSYEFGSTPRSKVEQGVYTSTEYPAHQTIPQHNEQAYTRQWPMRIWFYCHTASPAGGETPIADSREVYRRIPQRIRQRFIDKGLMYVRNYGNGLDVPWQQVFNTGDRSAVEAYCRSQHIAWEWKDDDELRTRQVCQAIATHPRTGDTVWFNQAHLFHISALEAAVRDNLLAVVDEEDLPRNVYYGDGSPIEDGLLDEIRAAYDSVTVRFPWQAGDVLMLDNMLATHGRAPFSGPRKVVVAMAQSHGV